MVDLHVHSTKSDGTFTPAELVNYAVDKGLSAIALTDHDSVDGINEAEERANILSLEGHPIDLIPGIELSTGYYGKDVHVLGLAIDINNPGFKAYLIDFQASRVRRNRKMCEKIRQEGMEIYYEDIENAFPGATLTRANYARYLVNNGFVKDMKEAFSKYLGEGCPCYVPRDKITPKKAVELILMAGGIPVLAHPILYHMSDRRLEELTSSLKEAGLMGIEGLYSTYSPADERDIRELAQKYDLLISGGSDFHGSNKPSIDMGIGKGGLVVPDDILRDLRSRQKEYYGNCYR